MGLARAGKTGLITPMGVVAYQGIEAAARLLAQEMSRLDAKSCLIGLPLDAEGIETGGCKRSRALGRALENCGYRVIYQPEYLTTREARHRAREIGRSPLAPVDDLAAVILLEDFLGACGEKCGLAEPVSLMSLEKAP